MNIAWKIVVFTLCINVASAMINNVLPENNIYDAEFTSGIVTNSDIYDVSSGNTSRIDTIPVTGEVNWADNLLGLVGLGFIVDLIDMLTDYLYGLSDILLKVLPKEVQNYESYINWAITLCYSLSLFSLFTGKNLNEDN